MKCPNCGYENGENSKFCLKCGTKLGGEQIGAAVNEDVTVHETDINETFEMEKNVEAIAELTVTPDKSSGKINDSAPLVNTSHKANFFEENKSKILIIAGSAAIVALIGGCIAWDTYRQNNIPPEVKPTPMYAEVLNKEKKDDDTKATSAETSVQSQTQTTVSTSAVTESNEDKYDDYGRQSVIFELSGATVVFEPNEEYYVSDGYCTSYLSYSPRVTGTSSPDAAKNIENGLAEALSFSELTSKEYGTKTAKRPEPTFGDMSYQNFIIDMYEENGLLFASINTVSDMGGGMSLSVYGEEKTYIYDLSDGKELRLDDIVKDRDSFLGIIDNYICETVYDRSYINTEYDYFYGYENYTLDESISYDEFAEAVYSNPWYDNEWGYDGEQFRVNYHFLLGYQTYYKDTKFFIPKSLLANCVDFSVGTSSKNTDGALRDALGCKIMSGNTAANYANYTGYCFDEEYIYYAGGEDGYHWQLRKNIIGGSGLDGELISDDMTDAVMVYGDRIYYRNASDGYKLYSISKNGTDKKALTDAKASAIRLYDGKIYFTSDGKLFRMDMDGKNKEKIFERGCYDLQIYDDRIYTASEDNSCIYIYDLSGTYQGAISSSYTPTIKWFFVSYGNCVMANENSVSIVDVSTFSGVSYTEMNIKGISENKNDYLFVEEVAGRERVICISKKNTESDSFYDFINGINNREFYVIYDDYNTYIYTFDKDGVVTSEVLGDY